MLFQALTPLDSSILNASNLVGVVPLPLLPVEVQVKAANELRINKIDKSVPHVTVVLEVYRKIEEIVGLGILVVKGLEEHISGVLIGNVLDHKSSASVIFDLVENNVKLTLLALLDFVLFPSALVLRARVI